MQEDTIPVLIVGSGPSGLVLALVLRMNGVHVRIIEKKAAYPVGQRGAGVQARSLEMHHILGTLPDIQEKAIPIPTIRFLAPAPNGDKVLKETEMVPAQQPTPAIPYPNPVVLGQNNQEAILRKHLAQYNCHVELDTELRSFEQAEDSITATTIKNVAGKLLEERSKYRWLAGADGARGVVRKQLGLSFVGETRSGESMVIGDIYVENDVFSGGVWYMWGQAKQSFVSVRRTEDKNIVSFMVSNTTTQDSSVEPTRQDFLNAFLQVTGRDDVRFGDLVWIGHYRPNIRMVEEFGQGRVLLVGDAAHVHSITGGQGMNSSIQDSFNLAWKLALVDKGLAPTSLLSSYSDERVPVIAEMLQITTKFHNRTLKNENGDGWKRDNNVSMLGVNYRGSPIVLQEGSTSQEVLSGYDSSTDGILRAGDRAPDAPGLVRKDGTLTRLFDIFKPTQHTILIFGGDHLSVVQILELYPEGTVYPVAVLGKGSSGDDVESVVDQGRHTFMNYNVREGERRVVIVRPDGIIGAILFTNKGIREYFSKIFSHAIL